MESIYSNIIWDKLGEKNYKIHNAPWHITVKKMCDYFETISAEEIKEVLIEELSWIEVKKNTDYYDGNIHEISQATEGKLILHDNALIPSLLHLMIELNITPDELSLLQKLLTIYRNKVQNSSKD